MKLYIKSKWVILAVTMLIAPLCYGYFMAYWTALISLSITQLIVDLTSAHITRFMMVIMNALGITVIGLLLSVPLNKAFGGHGYLAALPIALTIIIWSFVTLIDYSAAITNIFMVIEWGMLLVIMPLSVRAVYKFWGKYA